MNDLQIFDNPEFGKVRALLINKEPWFVGKDVATALGYERATKAVWDHVEKDDRDAVPIQDSIGRMQNTPIINESGVYSLVFASKLPTAKEFKHWVT
ncbi:MAG: Bro-N domain-containing protein [Eubacterium sp.]